MTPTRILPIPVLRAGLLQCHLLIGDRPILVDTGVPGRADRVLRGLAAWGVSPRDLALIILTHGHMDHMGNAAKLRLLSGAPVVIHRADAPALRTGRSDDLQPTGWVGRLLLRTRIPQRPTRPCEPDLVVDGARSLADFGVDGEIIPTPGHTPGSLSVRLSGGDVLSGDLLATGWMTGHPGAKPDRPPFEHDAAAVHTSLRRLLAGGATVFHPAHGRAFSAKAVEAFLARTRA